MITTFKDRWVGIATPYDLTQWYNDVQTWCDKMNIDYTETLTILRGF